MTSPKIQRALISVSDKSQLGDFASGLADLGVEIYSTGGTRSHLEESGLAVQDISSYTGFPEMMDGRLKTLHPKVFGGILCRHDRGDDMDGIAEHGICSFELVVVNLYPFEQTVARAGVTDTEAIEKIDIGGPSLVRAAAKNHAFVTIATDPSQYDEILSQLRAGGATTLETRRRLAGAAFQRTAAYDRAIADYFARDEATEKFPPQLSRQWQRAAVLRYGENPHQEAAVYADPAAPVANLVAGKKLHGKELSYNNLLDLDAALAIARSLPQAAASVVKHNNPCGAASAATLATAVSKAMQGDPLSAFGSVLGFNRPADAATAEVLAEPGLFVEAIVAPGFSPEAIEILTTRPKWRNNVRLIEVGDVGHSIAAIQMRQIEGGVLLQESDNQADPEADWKVATKTQPDDAMMAELRFAWEVCRHVKSNAIVVTRDQMLCGAGAGQMSRVDSVDIAIQKAGDRVRGAMLASDAFFPFPDSIEKAAQAGIVGIIQPGGSRRDEEVIAACDEHGLAMVMTGRRHFKH
jgi:phosphoribosylaminoimidazolecarboxamide formyltransferase/IMP cyclohydrolase